jgi:histidinol-phosphatase (PHP family)
VIEKAIALKYDVIAITEHYDLLPQELASFGAPSLRKYISHLERLKQEYSHAPLRILCGIEIGDYQLTRPQVLPVLEQVHFDLVLGAVHFLSDHTNVAVPLKNPLSPVAIEDYYRHNLALVTECDIDVLAHLGVYKRYYGVPPAEDHCLGMIRDIFQTMISRGIALEVNLSGLRNTFGRLLPEPWQIDLYRQLDGNLFSLGSDSHQFDHFHDHYDDLPPDLLRSVNLLS